MNEKCQICKFICEKDKTHKINSTLTLYSKVLLQDFIEIVIEDELNIPDSHICSICYDLLNELDKFRENYHVGCERIKRYLKESQNEDLIKENHKEIVLESIESTPGNVEILCTQKRNPQKKIGEIPKQYICEICGISYKTQKSLKVHLGMHKGINPFTCRYCGKSFMQKISLIRHLPLHTGEAPFQCDLCGKRYIHDSSFRLHKKTHKGQKDVKCEKCHLAFFSKSHLKRHQRVHTGEKNYTCETCGKSFAEKYNLVAHEKLHGNSKSVGQFRCEICNMVFYKKISLEGHLKQVHQKINISESLLKVF